MTQIAENVVEKVRVACAGVTCPVGFSVSPDGYAPTYVQFSPEHPVAVLERHYAEWVVKQDPTRFSIESMAVQKEASNEAVGNLGVSVDKTGHKSGKSDKSKK